MEVIGVVAASAQLVGTARGILETIVTVREYLQYASERLQSWQSELHALQATIRCIKLCSILHNSNVEQLLEDIGNKIRKLCQILGTFRCPQADNLCKKIFKALSSKGTESRILQIFTELERHKGTLNLAIATAHATVMERLTHNSGQGAPSDRPVSTTSERLVNQLHLADLLHIIDVVEKLKLSSAQGLLHEPNAITNQLAITGKILGPFHNPMPPSLDHASQQPPPAPKTTYNHGSARAARSEQLQDYFKNIQADGDGNFVGMRRGGAHTGHFEDIGIRGNGNNIGSWGSAVRTHQDPYAHGCFHDSAHGHPGQQAAQEDSSDDGTTPMDLDT